MDLKTKRKLLYNIVLLILVLVIGFYGLQKYYMTHRGQFYLSWAWNDTSTSCQYETEGDALPPAEGLFPPDDSIFFHETSCRGGLDSRQACAVESVARKHPERPIYVFFNSPVSEDVLTRSCLARLTQFKNVNLARLNTTEHAKRTPLGEMLAHRESNRSRCRIELTTDMLRYITLYRYGGLCLDTDVLVVKPLYSLGKDWAAREDDKIVNAAVLAISKEGPGRELIRKILEDIKSDSRLRWKQHRGPGALTRALLKLCNATTVKKLNADICHGFKVYSASLIYPVHWRNADIYFKSGKLSEYTQIAFMHHLSNKLTSVIPLKKGSPYDELAWQHCPSIRSMYGDKFGM